MLTTGEIAWNRGSMSIQALFSLFVCFRGTRLVPRNWRREIACNIKVSGVESNTLEHL
jgi:hypothetical protein